MHLVVPRHHLALWIKEQGCVRDLGRVLRLQRDGATSNPYGVLLGLGSQHLLHGSASKLFGDLEFVGFMQTHLYKVLGQRHQLGAIGSGLVDQPFGCG